MITRIYSRPHICLTCQRNLARRIAPTRTQVAFQSSSAISPDIDQNAGVPEDNEDEAPPSFTITKVKVGPHIKPVIEDKRKRKEDVKPAKFRGLLGHRVEENREDLKIDNLGKSAEVIILRDSKLNYYVHDVKQFPEEVEPVDIISQLQKERGLVGVQEVFENISGFKPREGHEPQAWEDFNHIVQSLSDGFTQGQLTAYIEAFGNQQSTTKASQTKSSADIVDEASISHVSSWMPGISDYSAHFDVDPTRGYQLASYNPKQKLAVTVLRKCWELQLPIIEEGVGQFEITLSADDLRLMTKGKVPRLASIFADYLSDPSESLQTIPSRNVLRFTTWRHKMDIILNILGDDLHTIQRRTISLGDLFRFERNNTSEKSLHQKQSKNQYALWKETYFNENVLQELSDLTGTDIVEVHKNKIVVSSFDCGRHDGLSNPIDVVQRLLLASCSPEDNGDYSLQGDVMTSTPGSYVPYTRTEGFSWRDSKRQWMRWTTPVWKAPEGEVNQDPTTQIKGSERTNESPGPSNVEKDVKIKHQNGGDMWYAEKFIELSATFGSLLHCKLEDYNRGLSLLSGKKLRAFSTKLANLTRFLRQATLINSQATEYSLGSKVSYLTLRFLPNPFVSTLASRKRHSNHNEKTSPGLGAEVFEAFPPVEMQFAISKNGDQVNLKDVVAVVAKSTTDTTLPTSGLDIRWQEDIKQRLRWADVPSISQFVANSNLNILAGKLETPPGLRLPIDEDLCLGNGIDLYGKTKKSDKIVDYLFSGSEIRHEYAFDYHGWRLLLTDIDAGRAGGRRSELRLLPIYSDATGTVVNRDDDYIKVAYQIVRELGGTGDMKVSNKSMGSEPWHSIQPDKPSLGGGPSDWKKKWKLNPSGERIGYWKKGLRGLELVKGLNSATVATKLTEDIWSALSVTQSIDERLSGGNTVEENKNQNRPGELEVSEQGLTSTILEGVIASEK